MSILNQNTTAHSMYFNGRVRNLGEVDHRQLKEKVHGLAPETWLADRLRQERFKRVHSQTQSIILLFCEGWPNVEIRKQSGWDLLSAEVMPLIHKIIASNYPPGGTILRAMIAKLPAGSQIKRHYDRHPSFQIAHRIHLPLQTNDKVNFIVKGQKIAMADGNAYELNNILPHEVSNDGTDDRIHLIFDYVPPRQQ